MNVHTTNYQDTLIEVAEDCPVACGVIPPQKEGQPTTASLQFDLLKSNPYKFTSDDILFRVYALKKGIPERVWEEERKVFFSKGQACLRASPLTKRYGWGVHSNEKGLIAIYGMQTEAYRKLQKDPSLRKLKAMRLKRA